MRALLAALSLIGCTDAPASIDAGTDAPPVCTAPAEPSRLVVTADWMARSLTLLGLERVLDPGCSAEQAIVGTIDLSAHAPGPIELEIAPDGRTAVVAIGPGFYEGIGAALVAGADPEADGALLLVDLVDRAITAEIPLLAVPMGIAIAPDGARAYVAEYGLNEAPGRHVAIVDLATRTLIDEVEIGSRPEQVVLDPDGVLGAVTIDDGTRVFRTSDVAGTLSPTIATGRDPSDLDFVAGADRFVVSNSMAGSVTVVDVTDPAAPTALFDVTIPGAPYAVTAIRGSDDVIVATSIREILFRVDARDPDATPRRFPLTGGSYLLQAVVTPDARHAIAAHPGTHQLAVVDLDTGATHAIAWLDRPGPTYVALTP